MSHPDVLIAAIAARDESKASAFAKKWSIPDVHPSYQALLDDPKIDAVYIPLPNGLHYEWALKALKAGKHVLLEKPSTSNAVEAAKLFRNDLLQPNKPAPAGKGLILLEAFHSFFHPAFKRYLSLIDQPNIIEAWASLELFKGIVPRNDIRYNYDLAGGSLLDCGPYCIQALRQIFGQEPTECSEAQARRPADGDERIDEGMTASFKFSNGGVGTIKADLAATIENPLPQIMGSRPAFNVPVCWARHREKKVSDDDLPTGQEHSMSTTVSFWNYVLPSVWHRIDVVERHTVRDLKTKVTVKTWTKESQIKEYSEHPSWTTYRYQLDEFVRLVRKKGDAKEWYGVEKSIGQLKVVDSVYNQAGLPLRPSNSEARST